jgi:hypothetical protein
MNDPNKTAHGLANLKSNIDSMVHWGQLVVPYSLFSLLISLVVLGLHKLCACSAVGAFGLFVRALANQVLANQLARKFIEALFLD